jgi:hypothetical protein
VTGIEKLRRFGLDKVALFFLLLAGLLFAKLLVSSRANLKLSKPVVLQGSGLAVSVPAGGGFNQLSDSFEYNDNEFRLSCILRINSNTAVSTHWRYFLLPFKRTASERFQAQALAIAGSIEKTGSEQFGQFTFDYAKIVSGLSDKSEKTAILLFSGITQLPDGRTLTLEVDQRGWNIDLAEKIFKSLAASVTFTPDSPLAKGAKLLDNFRRMTLADIVPKKAQQNYYYIKNYTDQSLGFITDAISLKTDSPDTNSLVAVNLYFIYSGMNSFAEQSLFRSEPNLQSFKWVSRQSNLLINRDLTTSIELDRQGMITVQTSATPLSSVEDRKGAERNIIQNFIFTSTMLPEVLFDTFIESFLQSDFDSVMVDMILSDGRITPVIITRTEPQKAAQPNAASAVEAIFFGSGISYQTTYFDSNGKILLSEVHGKISYKLEKTEKDRLIADYPQWLEKIQQIGQYILEKSEN